VITRRDPRQRPNPRFHYHVCIAAIILVACNGDLPDILEPGSRISISPLETSLLVGETERFTAQAYNADNEEIAANIRWSSSDPTVASVEKASGVVTAVATGTATISVAAGILDARATITVLPAGPAKLSTSRSSLSLIVGAVERIAAQAFDAKGRLLLVPIQWSSSNPAIATVTADGVVNAIGAGTTTVTANTGTLSANVTVSVIKITGSVILFARHSNPNTEAFSSEVLLYSVLDNALSPLSPGNDLGSIAAPTWSPDGSQLAVEFIRAVFYDDINHWTDFSSDLYVLVVGEEPRALTTDGQSRKPSWSPDGSRIAFVKRPAQYSGSHIYVIGADGGSPTRLTQREGLYDTPRWSPDGGRLAFSDLNNTQHDVYVMNADGTALRNITSHAGYDAEPSWSPDGGKIAFISDRQGGRTELFVAGAAGGAPQRLTALGGTITAPVWSPDGRQIVFTLVWSPSPSWPPGVYVVNADGSSLTRLIDGSSKSVDLAFAWRSTSFRLAASARVR
jgi:Big-like domain-containing protein/WD40 repeat protein